MTIQQAFDLALQHHQAGRFAEAEALYRRILTVESAHAATHNNLGVLLTTKNQLDQATAAFRTAIDLQPNYADAHNNLGMALAMRRQTSEAITAFRRALALAPGTASYHCNLADALKELGQLEEAIPAYYRAIELRPDFAEAHNNLGNALQLRHELDQAIAAFRRALEIRPDFARTHYNLGNALREQGRLDEAIAAYRRALELQPADAAMLNNLGIALKDRGRFQEAIATFKHALEIDLDYAEASNNLGIACQEYGQPLEAIAAYRRALELQPELAEAYNNLGNVLKDLGQLDKACAEFRKALQLRPRFAEAHNNLANVLRNQGHLDEAVAEYRCAIELQPGYAEAHTNLGVAFHDLNEPTKALTACQRAIELDPLYADAHNKLGVVLKACGRLDEAVAAFRQAVEIQNDLAEAHNNLGIVLRERGETDSAVLAFRQAVQLAPNLAYIQSNLIFALHFAPSHQSVEIADEQQRWKKQFSAALGQRSLPLMNDPNPERPLRIGYISSDFCNHVVGRNVSPLLRLHHHEEFEVICYSGVVRPDRWTAEFHKHADMWRSTVGVPDKTVAEMIRQDKVDVLVDLAQHSANNRLPLFTYRPAPVQVSFAGYPESAGLETIPYRISDRYLECGISELQPSPRVERKVIPNTSHERVFLIDSFWCYDSCGAEAAINDSPARENGYITFGSLNSFCKVNEAVLRLWARVLRAVHDSRLVMLCGKGSHRQRTIQFLQREGIVPKRMEFFEPCTRNAYLELYQRFDVVLDTFPYNGHTTSLDALWMGLPVVSLAGDRPVSRAGVSQLSNLGLPELVAHSEDEYVQIATRLAGERPRLADWRRNLRARMERSVLMDGPRFTRNIEAAYRAMWRRWCEQQAT